MISSCYLKNYNFFNIIFKIIFFLIILYLWFKVISIETTVFILEQKLKKDNNINNSSCVSGVCSVPTNNNYESFNTFPMDDMIMKEVFSYCEQPEETTHNNIKLPVAEHVKIVIEDNNDQIMQKDDEIKKNNIFDLKKEDLDNTSVNSNITKKKNKLNKLNLEALKQKCIELNLESEGSKNELIDRILNNDS